MTSRRQAERAMEIHADELSAFPNVVGLGMSETGEDDRPRSHALVVYVTEKKPASELDAGELLPRFVEIADKGDTSKVPVKVIEVGEIQPEGAPPEGDSSDDADTRRDPGDDGSTFYAQ